MSEEKKTRVRHPVEEKKAALEAKIKYHQDCINTLQIKLKKLDEPSKRGGNRQKNGSTLAKQLGDEKAAAALGMTVEEYRAKLKAALEANND